jgi:hypothetical protein
MPGSATDYLETQLLQHTLRIAPMPEPAAIYMVLCLTAPTDSTPGQEVSGGGYVRMAATFALVSGRTDAVANTATVEWPPAGTAWGTVGWAEIWDAATAGNRLYWGPLVDPTDMVTPITRVIQTQDIMRVPLGSYLITAD